MSDNPILWSPDAARRDGSAMFRFMRQQGFDDYESLHRWSIEQPTAFWQALIDDCEVEFSTPPKTALAHPERIMHAGWFDGSTINYARHLLRHKGSSAALVFVGEDGRRSDLSFDELSAEQPRPRFTVGIVDDEARLDLPYEEDGRAQVDMNVVATGSGQLVEIQGTGEGHTFSRAELDTLTDRALGGVAEIPRVQSELLGAAMPPA